jgi:hypothetical protein
MSEKELRKLISESFKSVKEGYDLSGEDQEIDTDEFEDSLGSGEEDYEDMDDDMNLGIEPIPMSAVDMPIQDKAYLNVGGEESYDDEFSDVNGYKEFGNGTDDYEGNWQDDVSVSPGYFNENKIVKITTDDLKKIIKEGVAKLHKKTLIENRLEQINQELNALNNPQAWQDARDNAQAELEKKTLNWKGITQRSNGLIGENFINEDEADRVSSQEIFDASNNPYGSSMYFVTNYDNILNQDEAMELADNVGDSEYVVSYEINWEGDDMHTESGKVIPSAYGVETEVEPEELYEALKAFVKRK